MRHASKHPVNDGAFAVRWELDWTGSSPTGKVNQGIAGTKGVTWAMPKGHLRGAKQRLRTQSHRSSFTARHSKHSHLYSIHHIRDGFIPKPFWACRGLTAGQYGVQKIIMLMSFFQVSCNWEHRCSQRCFRAPGLMSTGNRMNSTRTCSMVPCRLSRISVQCVWLVGSGRFHVLLPRTWTFTAEN